MPPPYIGRGRPLRLPGPNSCDHPRNRPTSQDSTVMSARERWPQSKRNQSARDTSQGQWSDPSGPGGSRGNNTSAKASARQNPDEFEIMIRSISLWPQKGRNYWDRGSLSKRRPKQLRAGNYLNISLESCRERKQSLRLGSATKQSHRGPIGGGGHDGNGEGPCQPSGDLRTRSLVEAMEG
jgi:hypothetical protein